MARAPATRTLCAIVFFLQREARTAKELAHLSGACLRTVYEHVGALEEEGLARRMSQKRQSKTANGRNYRANAWEWVFPEWVMAPVAKEVEHVEG